MIPDSFLPGRGQTHHTTQEAATSTPGLLEAVDAESGVSGNHTASVLRRADDDSRCRWGNLLQRQFQHRRRRLVADGFADVDGVVGGQRPAVEWQARQVIQRRDEHQREGGGFKGASTAAAAGCIRPHHHSVQTDVAQRQPFQRFRNSLDETSSWHQLTSLLSEIERVWRMHGWIPAGWIQSWTHPFQISKRWQNEFRRDEPKPIHPFLFQERVDGWMDRWMDGYLENFIRFTPAELPVVEEERPQLGARLHQRLEESQRGFIPQRFGRASASSRASTDFGRLFIQRQVQLRQPLEARRQEDEVGAA